ncbi:MAG: hypothetical protein F6K23_06670 [Okeania sp. SIO2C9]|uniref:hypothetical protein n=1 Tax=Okeania sp. SIO2C9 TaxID=2607791 RepID=UPI0013C0F4E8|nr:hypothetical protein [Okeania sp. SIO2C9]NEQ72780.1 hypothetical protein [Okeania sp. SIO2C9]
MKKSTISLSSQYLDSQLQAIAYSMDALIPGLYIWLGWLRISLGGSLAEENYPGTVHSFWGVSLILPGYRIYTTTLDRQDSIL